MKRSSILAAKFAGAGALALLLATSAFADSRPQDGTSRGHDRRDGNVTRDNNNTQRGANTRDAARLQRDTANTQRDNRASQRDTASGTYQRDRANQRNDNAYQRDRANGANQRNDGAYQRDNRNNTYQRNGQDQAYRNGRDNGRNSGSYGRSGAQQGWRNNEHVQMRGRISRYSHERGGYRVWLDNGGYSYWVPERFWLPSWRIGIDIGLGGIFRDGVIYADTYDPYYDGGGSYGYSNGYSNDYVSGYVDRVDYRSGIVWIRDDNSGRLLTVDTRSIDPRYSRIDGRDLRPGDRVTMTGSWVRGGVFAAGRIDTVDAGRY